MTKRTNATVEGLRRRAHLLDRVRHFFKQRHYLEVETPELGRHGVTDVNIDSFKLQNPIDNTAYYLQTSPEFFMKRLLAAGSGPIFQIAKVFRQEGAGVHHNPEFTLLEWYRPHINYQELMTEVDQLLQDILNSPPAKKTTYQDCFQQYCNIDPFDIGLQNLQCLCKQHHLDHLAQSRTDCLQLLMSYVIEPQINKDKPLFIYDYPQEQAALAKTRPDTPPIAERFELYYQGLELANGFTELNNSKLQQARFKEDLKQRKSLNKSLPTIDKKFIDCLDDMPNCAGVAMGIDRLVMIDQKLNHIKDSISFDWESL
jgi:elongation factor P--(R)-beta-lysine ligase